MTRSLLLLLASALFVPALARGQTVRGEVVDGESLRPLEGSVVVVIDAAGSAVRSAITSSEGRFVARLPGPGTYALRVDRIGYESVTTAAFRLEPDEDVFRRFEIAVVPVTLDGIEVSSGRACVVRPGADALATARVWEQARTALAAAATTQRQQVLRFDTEIYARELDGRSLSVRSEERAVRRGGIRIPFGSPDADDLAENGYIQPYNEGEYYDFYAPTADVLLSDSFLDTHCFRLEEGEDDNEGLIGLRFEPVERRDVADISGTIWLDRATSALRHAEMQYVSRDPDVPTEGALARVDFEAMPGGRWIVGRWFIRMPQMVERRMPGGFAGTRAVRAVDSFRVEGGEVTRITDASGAPILAAARFAASGVVYDSLRGGPLSFARISLEGTSHRVVADGSGRFVFADVAAGRYTVRVDHARLDSLPAVARPRGEIAIGDGSPAQVDLATPSLRTVVEAACPGLWNARPGSSLPSLPYPVAGDVVLTGIVVDGDGRPIENATAHVSWDAFTVTEAAIRVRRIIPSTTTDAEGRFTVCGVPPDMPLSVWATVGDATSVVVQTRAYGRFAFAATIVK